MHGSHRKPILSLYLREGCRGPNTGSCAWEANILLLTYTLTRKSWFSWWVKCPVKCPLGFCFIAVYCVCLRFMRLDSESAGAQRAAGNLGAGWVYWPELLSPTEQVLKRAGASGDGWQKWIRTAALRISLQQSGFEGSHRVEGHRSVWLLFLIDNLCGIFLNKF